MAIERERNMAYTFTEEGSEILKKYGIETQSQPQQAQKQQPQVDMSKGVGGVGTGIRQSIKGENWVEALGRNAEAGVRYRKKAEEEVAKLGRGADYQLRGANFSDSGRQILAKYGLADYTDDELIDMSMWEQRRADYYGEVGDAYKHLGGTEWSDWMMDQRHSSAVDYRIQELEQEMERVGKNSPAYAEMQEYHAMLLRMKEGYTGRSNFYGMFSDENDYNGYTTLMGELRDAEKNGEDWNDIYLRHAEPASYVSASGETIEITEKRVADLEDKLQRLKAAQENGEYYEDENGYQPRRDELPGLIEQTEKELEEERAFLTQQQAGAEHFRAEAPIAKWAKIFRYQDLPQKEDWNEQVAAGREQMYALQEQERQRREQEAAETRQGNVEVAGLDDTQLSGSGYLTYRIPDGSFTKEQQDTWCYLYMRSPEEAYEYAIEIYRNNKNQTRAERMKEFQDWAGQNVLTGTAATAYNLVFWPTALWDVAGNLAEYANTGLVMPRDDLSPSDWGDAMQAGVTDSLNNWSGTLPEDWAIIGGKGLGDAYQLGMSIAQSMEAARAGGGVANVLFFGTAAKHGTEEALARGASDGQALVYGMLCGAAEVLGETISIEHLVHMKDPATAMRLLKNVLKQGGIEASEEAFTTLLTTAADAIVMGDKSALNQRVQELILQGMSQEEAEKKAAAEWFEGVMQDALGGFLSGGISGGIYGGINMGRGSRVEYSGTDRQALLDAALQMDQKSPAYALAQKIQQNGTMSVTEATRLRELMGDTGTRVTDQQKESDRAQIQQRAETALKAAGVENPGAAAQLIAKEVMGEKLSREERRVLKGVQQAEKVSQALQEQLRTETNFRSYQAQLMRQDVKKQNAARKKGADTRTTSVKGEKGAVKIEELTVENGRTMAKVTGTDGKSRTVAFSSLELDDYQRRALNTFRQVLGRDAIAAYNSLGSENIYSMSAYDIMQQAIAWGNIRNMFGAKTTDAAKSLQGALASQLRGKLSDAQVEQAFEIGRKHAQEEKTERPKSKRGTGHVSLDGGTVDGMELKGIQNKDQVKRSKEYRAVKAIAKALGIDVVLFESEAVNESGDLRGIQGAYQDGVIYLDWNAGMKNLKQVGSRMLLRTMSHELTHFIQQNAPELYEELKDYVTDYLADKMGAGFNDLVAQKMAGRNVNRDGAIDEVVADACETMLRDSQAVKDLVRNHRSLWQSIKDFVLKYLGNITAEDTGAIYMQDAIQELQEIWGRGLKAAVENRTDVETGKTSTEVGSIDLADYSKAKGTDGKPLFQVRAFEHDEPQYREMLEKWGGMSTTEIDELFNTVDVAMAKIMKNLEALDYAWEEDIDDRGFQPIKQNSDKLYKVSLDFSTLCRKRLLQGLIAGQLSAALQRGLSKEEGIAVRDALLAIQAEGKQIEVACALCYVESARMRSQKAIQEFLNDREGALRNYYANQHGREAVAKAETEERQAIYNELLRADKAAGKPMSEWGLVRGKGDDTSLYDIRDTKKAKMSKIPTAMKKRIQDAKKAARTGYALTAQQQATLDYANSLPVEAFTTPEGLQDLAKSKYRDVFNAFVLKVSAASKSKGIENDTWWRAGDSQAIGDLLIKQMNAENGLRTQSWSDFTVKHLMDYIAATIELSTRGAKQHAYTKVLDYVDLMGNTGLMINMSLIPARDYNGKLEYDDVEGINYKEALKMREKFPDTAGTICIGITVDQVHQLLESMEIDYVIPYHSSGMSKDTRKLMHIPAWENFQDYQSEKKLSGSAARENARKYGVELLSESDPLWHQGPSFSEWFDLGKAKATAKRVGKTGKYGVMTGGYAAMQEAAENYKRICAQRGLAPKFSYGSAAFDADFSKDAGYWKLLIDRKMVNNKTGEIIEQRALKPIFKFETVERILNDELKRYGRVKADQDEAIQRVTRAFLTGDVKAGMSSDEIAKVMQKPVDNIPITNITQNAAQMSVRPRTAEEVEAEAEEMSDARTQYSVRQSPPPKKTMIGYKVFMVDKKHKGQLYPTKVKNPGGQGTPVGVWLDADTGEIARNPDGSIATNTLGRISVKANGGTLAWRPGWHLGSLPEANQMNRADPKNPNSNNSNRGTTGLMWDNYVFCECEFAADEDYQLEAFEFGTDEKGSYKHTQAGLPYIPKDGYYKYRTNPDPSTAPWFISGSIRITKILDDDMRREIIEKWNAEHPDQQMRFTERYSRKPINLTEYGLKAGPVTPTEDLSSVAPGVDYSDEIKNLPGYTRHALNFDDPRVQEAFRIQQIEDKKDYYIDKYNREHRDELESGSKKAARAQLATRNTDYYVTGDLDVDTDRAYAAATPLQDEMNDIVRGISEELGTKYEASTQKSKKSIKNKIIRKHDEGRTGYTVLDMKDHARSKVYVNEWSEIPKVLAYLRREGIQYETEAIGPTPYGYRGFHVTWRSNDGLGSELQITMPHVWQVKLISDGIYDKWRDIKPEDKDAQTVRQFEADLARSQKMWEELQLPDFTRWDTSSSESTRPDISVPRYTGVSGADHLLSTSSLYGNEDMSNTRPSSVSTNMGTPPSHNSTDIISQEAGDSKYPSSKMSMRSDTAKTDRELLKGAYQRMLKDKQWVIDQYGKQAQEDLEKYQKQAEKYHLEEAKVTETLDKMDKAVQDGDGDAVKALRQELNAAEGRMTTALKQLSQLQERPALQQILQRERAIERTRTRERIREGVNRRDLRQRVERLWKDMNRRITSPTEKKHIPVPVMQQAIEVLQALNMDTSREGTKSGEKLRAKLTELKARYEALQKDPDYRQAAMYDAQAAEYLTYMIEQVGDTPINKMSVAQLETVYRTLTALDHVARHALKLKLGEEERSAYEVSQAMTRETRSVPKAKTGLAAAWLNAQLSAERMFRRLGGYHKNSTWEQVYRMLNDGQLRQTQIQMEGSMIFADLLAAKDYGKFVDPNATVDIGLTDEDGNPVKITHGMLVSLWMHLQNEQNRRHVAFGGLTIPGLKDYYNGKKVKGSERAIRIGGALQELAEINDKLQALENSDSASADEIAELEAQRDEVSVKALEYVESLQESIEKQLTDYDRQWIAACRELFDGLSKRVLNQTTLEVYGIKRATVENYFPIWVDGDFLNTPFETVARDLSLENAGFMKERVDSSKPIRLADVSDVAASQIRKVSQYAGLMPAIRNFGKVWGKTQTGYRDSLRKAVHETFGQNGVNYIEHLMADLNGARGQDTGALGEFFNRMRGRMAQASLTMNLRVALGQTASYPTAAAVVGWKALHKALWRGGRNNWALSRADQELIRKWSPLLYYRMQGYRDTELGNIAGMNSKFDRVWKKARWLTGWIQAMDGATVGRLWYAAEYYVQDHNKDLQKGSDAYYEAVAKVFNDIVERTQPNYSTMQRPDILRNPNALVKQLTMFMTQRLQNFNILYDAAATYSTMRADYKAKRNGVTLEDVRQAARDTRRAAVSQVAAGATIVLFKALAAALMHKVNPFRDDDKELTPESVSMTLLDMFMDSMAGNVLFGTEVWDFAESKIFGTTYYGIELSGVGVVTDLIDAASTLFDHAVKGELSWKDADLLAKRLGSVAGIPYSNAKDIVMGGVHWVQDGIAGELFSFEAGVDRTTAMQAHRLYRAYQDKDFGKVNKIRGEVPEDKQKDLDEAVRTYIKDQYKGGDITVYEAMRQLQSYGNASPTVMANFIKDEYKAGNLQKGDAVKYLVEYAGRSQESAEKTVRELSAERDTGVKYSEINDQYMMGEISGQQATQMLVDYGGKDPETAALMVEFWDFQNKHPGTEMEFSQYQTYTNKYKPIGLSPEQYEDYAKRIKDCKGVDADGDGKTDSGSKKVEVVALIDSMDLAPEQKDQMYLANGYSESGLRDCPWNN